ncbi:GNAT family N-acetyltransferase [Zhihengliuella halotolerans]|uniref:GNAT family N-acetyltransferase n=1 Tax=Zhihengliuella halotolerans TaxID=370736 RepID=UPI00102C7E9E|nr:GNAT family N-acetyltransferase [Zhihengliuella halotolerans]
MRNVMTRWATLDDAEGIARVHIAAWQAAYRGLLPDDVLDGLDVSRRTRSWSRWLTASAAGEPTDDSSPVSHRLLVAETGARIVGWAGFGAGRDEGAAHLGELAGFYVHPLHWGRRVGHALLVDVEQELLAARFEAAYLWVLRGNSRAVEFYERHGWHADGTGKTGAAGGANGLHELRHRRQLG